MPHKHRPMLLAGTAAIGALALGFSGAQAQNGPAPVPPATTKERVDHAVSTVTGNPVSHADADMQRVLDSLKELKPKPIETLSAPEARQQPSPTDAVMALLKKEGKSTAPDPGVTTKDVSIAGPGGSNKARIYTPDKAPADGAGLPVVVYYHGGGWVIADLDTYDAAPRAIAKTANAIVVSAEYRHAPESKFPAAHDDAIAAYKWALDNAKSFGGDPSRIAVMGESAGGNLAINVAIAARDQHLQMPVYEVLVYPVAGVDMNTDSYRANAKAKPLNKAMMAWFFQQTIRSDQDKQDPRLDLVGRADLKSLPPTTVVTDQIDPLQSEGQMLAQKLKRAGVTVVARNYDGVTHEFFGMGAVVAKAKQAEGDVVKDLKTGFATPAMGSSTPTR